MRVDRRAELAQTYQAFDLYEMSLPIGFIDDLEVKMGTHELHASSQQAVTYSTLASTGEVHALLWNHADGAVVDIHPTNHFRITQSKALFAHGTHQVGSGWNSLINSEQAYMWNGTAASAVKLHPTNLSFLHSRAHATDGVQQAGAGLSSSGAFRALLWNGSAGSAINLHPTLLAFATQSHAYGVSGGKQVGSATTVDLAERAILWSGSANSAVNLHPVSLPDVAQSRAVAVLGNQQVGYALLTDAANIALLWTGSAASVVNLHPGHLGTFTESRAFATNGTLQAGSAITVTEVEHAMIWAGTAASAVDLHDLLPSEFFTSSATFVDAQGNVYGAAVDDDGVTHAIRWSPVAPASADFDGSGTVDGLDLAAWSSGFGTPGANHAQGDADDDADVDGADFLTWQRELGAGIPLQLAAAVVPEPGAIRLMIPAASLVLRKRRGR